MWIWGEYKLTQGFPFSHDITLGLWVFVFLNTVLLTAARSLSCQDNHGGSFGYCREIQPFFLGLRWFRETQCLMYRCCTYRVYRMFGEEQVAQHMFAPWHHLECYFQFYDLVTAVPLVCGETVEVWLHQPILTRNVFECIFLASFATIYKTITRTHSRPFQMRERQREKRSTISPKTLHDNSHETFSSSV